MEKCSLAKRKKLFLSEKNILDVVSEKTQPPYAITYQRRLAQACHWIRDLMMLRFLSKKKNSAS